MRIWLYHIVNKKKKYLACTGKWYNLVKLLFFLHFSGLSWSLLIWHGILEWKVCIERFKKSDPSELFFLPLHNNDYFAATRKFQLQFRCRLLITIFCICILGRHSLAQNKRPSHMGYRMRRGTISLEENWWLTIPICFTWRAGNTAWCRRYTLCIYVCCEWVSVSLGFLF